MGYARFELDDRVSTWDLDDCLAPLAYFRTLGRTEHLEPEQNLMHAILSDAIRCVRLEPAGSRVALDAMGWIMETGMDHVFSFEHICEVLGLDASYLRRGLTRQNDGNPAGSNRSSKAAA